MVIARRPEPGAAKTRLQPDLSAGQAAELYLGFLLDTLDLARSVSGTTPAVVYAPPKARAWFAAAAPGFALIPQQGGSLGERLDNALQHCFRHGSRKAVIMDSDSPTLPLDCLLEAFTGLDQADVTLGPTGDGGYYLIGLKRPAPRLLREVRMSTPTVAADTLSLAAREGLSVHLLPRWYDVDTPADLHHLVEQLHGLPQDAAPHTRAALRDCGWLPSG